MQQTSKYKNTLATLFFVLAIGSIGHAKTAEEQFYQAEACYLDLGKDEKKMKFRDQWLRCIEKFEKAWKMEPSGRFAPASLYMTGKLYRELYSRSVKRSDRQSALDRLTKVVDQFPGSDYRSLAEKELSALSPDQNKTSAVDKTSERKPEIKKRNPLFSRSKSQYRTGQKTDQVENKTRPDFQKRPERVQTAPSAPNNKLIKITNVRHWSNPSYTRIVIDAEEETGYTYKLLKEDLKIDKPPRLFIDFESSRLGEDIKKFISIQDNLLLDARAGQYKPDMVRVVIDIKSFKTYKVFSLNNPFRTIVDVWGKEAGQTYAATTIPDDNVLRSEPPEFEPPQKQKRTKTSDLARQLALGVKRIVIDPGHGGKDAGAVGYYKHVHEKEVVLKIGKQLARTIRKKLGCEVIMTRRTDRFLTLEERTAIANTQNADLFISLHTNAHKKSSAYGIETYFLNLTTDADAALVAARENAATQKSMSNLEKILKDLMQNSKINESSRLAGYVQKSMYQYMKKRYKRIKNKGVKQAPFYVLIGAQMPAILIETSFISNSRECKRLTDPTYQAYLCNAIAAGIKNYIQATTPTALLRNRMKSGKNG